MTRTQPTEWSFRRRITNALRGLSFQLMQVATLHNEDFPALHTRRKEEPSSTKGRNALRGLTVVKSSNPSQKRSHWPSPKANTSWMRLISKPQPSNSFAGPQSHSMRFHAVLPHVEKHKRAYIKAKQTNTTMFVQSPSNTKTGRTAKRSSDSKKKMLLPLTLTDRNRNPTNNTSTRSSPALRSNFLQKKIHTNKPNKK